MKIAIGCDHRGFQAKQRLKPVLEEWGHHVQDCGSHDASACDYPDPAYAVARAVRDGSADRGILFCGSGLGMSITANKVPGIRAALCHDEMTAELARHHNNANVLCLPADLVSEALIQQMVEVWLTTGFDGGRHARRIEKIACIEKAELQGHRPT